jgi:aminomethyltransferase
MKQFKEKSAARKRVGFVCEPAEGAKKARPAREGSRVFNGDGDEVGMVTSGVMSPCLGKPIGMAYVASRYQKAGNELLVEVGGKQQPLVVTKMPFTEPGYYRGPN